MFNLMPLIKSSLTTFLCLVIVMTNQDALAECEDILDPDFPSDDNGCSFSDHGINNQMLKFGDVDSVSNQSGQILVRFGSAIYSVSTSAEIHVVIDDDSCFSNHDGGFNFDLLDVESFGPIDNVAFIPSPTNSREIERIWVFRCDSIQSQSR